MDDISLGRSSVRTCAAGLPLFVTDAVRYSPLGVVTFCNWETSTPAFLAKACAAGVGCPSLYATFVAGPVSCSCTSGWVAGMLEAINARRRGVSERLIP